VPFTGSHPAAVLPLIGIGLAPSALVIGSMSPDFPYFAPGPFDSNLTHSLVGVVTADVVLSLVVYAVWHALLAPAGLAVAPESLRRRLPPDAAPGLRRRVGSPRLALLVAAACAVGALTHVLWDSFTHEGRWGARHVPWLNEQHGALPGYLWAQYASGVIGAAILVVWCVRWWRSTPHAPTDRHVPVSALVAIAVVAIATVVGALTGALPALTEEEGPDVHSAVFEAITRGGAAAGLAVVLVAAAILVRKRRSGTSTTPY
jgi:hypothetical protein